MVLTRIVGATRVTGTGVTVGTAGGPGGRAPGARSLATPPSPPRCSTASCTARSCSTSTATPTACATTIPAPTPSAAPPPDTPADPYPDHRHQVGNFGEQLWPRSFSAISVVD